VTKLKGKFLKQKKDSLVEQKKQCQEFIAMSSDKMDPQTQQYHLRNQDLEQKMNTLKDLEKRHARLSSDRVMTADLIHFLRRTLELGGGGASGSTLATCMKRCRMEQLLT
jgi:hypothetical protein